MRSSRASGRTIYSRSVLSTVLFPTHLVIPLLIVRGRFPVLWVVFGAALPDLVDKPLATVGLVPLYHSVVHSALFGSAFLAAWLVTRRTGTAVAVERVLAVAIGWATHLGADALHLVLNGRPGNAVFLLWPVVPTWDSIDASPALFVVRYLWTPSFYVEVGIWLLAGLLLLWDRVPERSGRRG